MLRTATLLILILTAGCAAEPAFQPPAAAPDTFASAAASSVPLPSPSAAAPCDGFPSNNIWRADVSKLPVHASSAAFITSIGASTGMHADFGSGLWEGAPIGIPVTTVKPGQATSKVTFQYASESDAGPYPIPAGVAIEGGPSSKGDRHIILHDPAACRVYELFAAYPASGGWKAGSGAIFDLRSNNLRAAGATSADAAGLPIWAGLVRYEEVAAGQINHAIRITVPRTRNTFVWPARHAASSSASAALPPMGLRLRLKSNVDLSSLAPQARIVAEAMKRYGVIVADNGSPWYVSGSPDEHWSNEALRTLNRLHGSDFEAVDTAALMASPDSATVK